MAERKKGRMGRPGKLETKEQKARFLKLIVSEGTLYGACERFGCVFNTLQFARERDEEFREAVEEALQQRNTRLRNHLWRRVFKSDRLLWNVVQCHMPEEYSIKQRMEHSGPDGKPIETNTSLDLSKLTEDDLNRFEELIRRATAESGRDSS